MIILVIDSTGRTIGAVKDYNVVNLAGKKVLEAKPKTTFKQIVKVLLADLRRHKT